MVSAKIITKQMQKVGTITTDSNGIAQMDNLPAGKYYVKEVKTAHGYVLDGEPRYVDLSYRDQDTPVITYDGKMAECPSESKGYGSEERKKIQTVFLQAASSAFIPVKISKM